MSGQNIGGGRKMYISIIYERCLNIQLKRENFQHQ